MDTVYVLMQNGWEYNDEYYFQSNGGSPRHFFMNKEDAERECDVLNIRDFRRLWESGEIQEYCEGGLIELIPYPLSKDKKKDKEHKREADALAIKIFGKDLSELQDALDSSEEIEIVSSSFEDWKYFMSLQKLKFWEVVPVQRG